MTDGGERSDAMLATVEEYTPAVEPGLWQWRCHHCRRLLAHVAIRRGWVEIKCRHCQTVNVLHAVEPEIDSQPPRPAL